MLILTDILPKLEHFKPIQVARFAICKDISVHLSMLNPNDITSLHELVDILGAVLVTLHAIVGLVVDDTRVDAVADVEVLGQWPLITSAGPILQLFHD